MGLLRANPKTSPMERKRRSFGGNSTDTQGGVREKQRGRLQVKGGGSTAGFGPKGRARSSSLWFSKVQDLVQCRRRGVTAGGSGRSASRIISGIVRRRQRMAAVVQWRKQARSRWSASPGGGAARKV